ncbi:MAG: NUDIX hydrolase [Deltaproteobacteria bacterium]|nr:NUDIX hydrolase [Deltaproteobacteria bacterium]MBW2117161.1 NUDIX hydrolase [Deltaproteobacteria bacterium]MBW2343571.1 NUDIX hydrolase [Deltaproteobacteria bacterium]
MMKREYPKRPFVGVSAVVFREQSVLLARRKQDPGRGQWSLPGGVVELGETLLEALSRELREEVSIIIEVGGLVGVYNRIIRDKDDHIHYHYIIVGYWGCIASGRPKPGSDISEVRFVAIEDIETCGVDPELRETILKAVEMRKTGLAVDDC